MEKIEKIYVVVENYSWHGESDRPVKAFRNKEEAAEFAKSDPNYYVLEIEIV
jgi:hypothetical protein